jgi:hypothetical protein
MRRLALVFALAVVALLPLGCAGPEGHRAQELLAQSDKALAEVQSMRFSGRMWMETPLGDFTFLMSGAGTTRGGGASYVTMRSPDVPEFPEMSVVVRGQKAWMKAGGRWQPIPAPPPQSAAGIEQFDFTPYVKDVDVDHGHDVAGEPAVKVTGVLDTAALVNGVFGQLGSVPGGALPDLSETFSDTRVVLYLGETSHLPLRTLVDMSVEAAGERVQMHMDFALTGFDEPVRIPRVRG